MNRPPVIFMLGVFAGILLLMALIHFQTRGITCDEFNGQTFCYEK